MGSSTASNPLIHSPKDDVLPCDRIVINSTALKTEKYTMAWMTTATSDKGSKTNLRHHTSAASLRQLIARTCYIRGPPGGSWLSKTTKKTSMLSCCDATALEEAWMENSLYHYIHKASIILFLKWAIVVGKIPAFFIASPSASRKVIRRWRNFRIWNGEGACLWMSYDDRRGIHGQASYLRINVSVLSLRRTQQETTAMMKNGYTYSQSLTNDDGTNVGRPWY